MTPRDLEILQGIHADGHAQLVREGGSGWREIPMNDFVRWYHITREDQLPDETPLGDFDVESVMDSFVRWVTKDFKDYQPKKPIK